MEMCDDFVYRARQAMQLFANTGGGARAECVRVIEVQAGNSAQRRGGGSDISVFQSILYTRSPTW